MSEEAAFQQENKCLICNKIESIEVCLSVALNTIEGKLSFVDPEGKIWIVCHSCGDKHHLHCALSF